MIVKSSFDSLASSFLISRSMLRAWFLAAEDCSFMFKDIIAAACEAAVADSF